MIARIIRLLGIRRRNVVAECHRDAIDRLNRQLVSAQLRAEGAEKRFRDLLRNYEMLYAELQARNADIDALKSKTHTLRDPITGRYKRKEG